jgi:uncharacterized protein involved in tolerance to divalent cations
MTKQTFYTVYTFDDEDDYGIDAFTPWTTIFTSKDAALAKIKDEFESIFQYQGADVEDYEIKLIIDQHSDSEETVRVGGRDCSVCFVITAVTVGE